MFSLQIFIKEIYTKIFKFYVFMKFWCFHFKNEIFVHFSALNMEGFKELKDGEKVEFEVIDGEKGPQASNVSRIA